MKIKCPNKDCETDISRSNIEAFLSEDDAAKFRKLRLNYEVMLSKDKKFCPFPGCENIVTSKPDTKRIRCQQCNQDFCFSCQIEWKHHHNKSCQAARIEMEKDWAIKIGANQCPRCKAPVEKNSGCPHMNCPICSYSWCWTCGLPLDNWIHKLPNVVCSFNFETSR